MKRAKLIAAVMALLGCAAVLLSPFKLSVLISVPLVYAVLCALLWSRSEQDYEGLAFGLQCASYFLLAVAPGFLFGLQLVSVADLLVDIPDQAYEGYVWGAGMGSVVWGIPAALIGGPILLGTELFLKRSREQ
jgi:hypothetical protein